MNKIENAVVITRHAGLVEYLKDIQLIDDTATVISHATADEVAGKNVIGVLPHSLSVHTDTFTEVPLLNLPAEMRGQELTADDVRKYADKPVTYTVEIYEGERD